MHKMTKCSANKTHQTCIGRACMSLVYPMTGLVDYCTYRNDKEQRREDIVIGLSPNVPNITHVLS